MALITTVMTTPLTMWLYPPEVQQKLEARRRGEMEWTGDNLAGPEVLKGDNTSESTLEKIQGNEVKRLLVYLRLDILPSLFTFIALLGGDPSAVSTKIHRTKPDIKASIEEREGSITALPKRPLEVHGLRMLELTERSSSLMKVNEIDDYSGRDPVVNAFRTFAQLNNVAVSGGVAVIPESQYAETLTSQASTHFSDLVLIPWSDAHDGILGIDALASGIQESFIQKALETSTCNTAVFFNRGFGGNSSVENRPVSRASKIHNAPIQPFVDRSHHVFFPFFGGVDDRAALRFVLQLAQNSNITVTIIHFKIAPSVHKNVAKVQVQERSSFRISSSKLEITERVNTEDRNASAAQDQALLYSVQDSVASGLHSRVMFMEIPTSSPIEDCLAHAREEIGQSPRNAGDLMVVGRGRHPQLTATPEPGNADLRKTLGIVAESLITGGVRGSVLVMQAGGRGMEA